MAYTKRFYFNRNIAVCAASGGIWILLNGQWKMAVYGIHASCTMHKNIIIWIYWNG